MTTYLKNDQSRQSKIITQRTKRTQPTHQTHQKQAQPTKCQQIN